MTLSANQETFDSIQAEWRNLLLSTPRACVFVTPAWARTWWDNCKTTEELLLLAFRDGTTVKGVAPLMHSAGVLRFIGASDLCDMHEFPVAPGAESSFFKTLFDTLLSLDWHTVELEGVEQDSPILQFLPALAREHGLLAETAPEEVSPRIPVAPTWDDYLARLGKKDRHELRRKFRRLEAAGELRFYNAEGDQLDDDVASFLELMRSSRQEKAAFMTAEKARFFHSLAQSMRSEGILKLFFLELDGLRVAASFCFDFQDTYYLYNSGYDTNYAGLSVGLLLKASCLREAIGAGKDRFDLLRGAENYKYHLGAVDHWLYRVTIRRPG